MLKSLKISNIALIRSQEIEFKPGLNVLTGETGAGKSLIIDSLSLLLGERADKGLISQGERVASVEAVFTDLSEPVKQVMRDLMDSDDEELIITRKLSVDGKNEVRVNGNAFTLSMLKKLSAPLMDLHGQFEHQNLLKASNHIKILDLFGGAEIESAREAYRASYKKYNGTIAELNSYQADDRERARLIDLYGYQIEEIENAAFYEGEEEELKDFRNQVLHMEKIGDGLSAACQLLSGSYDNMAASEMIKKAITQLSSITKFYDKASDLESRLDAVKIEVDDIIQTLEELRDGLYLDEGKVAENEKRLDLLSDFKKKYGSSISEINKYKEQIAAEYEKLTGSEERIAMLKKEMVSLEAELLKNAKALSEKRKKYAKMLENLIKNELVELGMKNSNFVTQFKELTLQTRNENGLDEVEFMFSANLGEDVRPLKNVASGGEMSRVMLAIKTITASLEGIVTLVFDEIDTGVSGVIALKLAEKLSSLGKKAQVICVTHLSQLASYGHNHLVIEKSEENGRTTTSVHTVSGDERVKEIARLISGNITEHSLSHAREMLEKGSLFYKNLK